MSKNNYSLQDMQELFQRIEQLERRCSGLENRISELEGKAEANVEVGTKDNDKAVYNADAYAKTEAVAEINTGNEAIGKVDISPVTHQPSSITHYYLSAPTPDGVFNNFSEREQVGKSIYLLSTADGINGTFILLDTPDAIATAIISLSSFVKPVCRIIGKTSQFPRHLVTDEEGTATRVGSSWQLVTKAVVRIE